MAEDRNTYKIHDNGSLGEVQIADEVVASSPDWLLQKLTVSAPWQEISPMNW